ncbi:hypothetical protein ACSBQ3_02485 [Staphylococcus equorum]|uniref:hypothetical protein n=1 Tax=Staphylococcus equorum TaxID=246432 RepID=UPI003EBDB2A1
MLLHLMRMLKGAGVGSFIFLLTFIAEGRSMILGAIILGAMGFLGYYFSFLYERSLDYRK